MMSDSLLYDFLLHPLEFNCKLSFPINFYLANDNTGVQA